MSKQTPLQKAIEDVLKLRVQYSHIDETMVTRADVLVELTELLMFEQETIEAAYEAGANDVALLHAGHERKYKNKDDYFTKTITQ